MSNNFNGIVDTVEEHNALMSNLIANMNDETPSSSAAMSPDDYKEIFEDFSESVQTSVSSPPPYFSFNN